MVIVNFVPEIYSILFRYRRCRCRTLLYLPCIFHLRTETIWVSATLRILISWLVAYKIQTRSSYSAKFNYAIEFTAYSSSNTPMSLNTPVLVIWQNIDIPSNFPWIGEVHDSKFLRCREIPLCVVKYPYLPRNIRICRQIPLSAAKYPYFIYKYHYYY